jgi:hypothetical protein
VQVRVLVCVGLRKRSGESWTRSSPRFLPGSPKGRLKQWWASDCFSRSDTVTENERE